MARYVDDLVFTFESMHEARRFYNVLPKRLAKYGLEMHMEKSSIIPAGHSVAMRADKAKCRLPTFKFLGFTCFWGKSRRGYWTLRFISRRDRFASKLKGLKDFLRKNLTTGDTPAIIMMVARTVRGRVNYHHISYNWRKVSSFIELSKRILLRWFNRRGGKKRLTWQKFMQILKFYGFPRKEDFRTTSVL